MSTEHGRMADATGLGSAEAPEPHSGLRPTGAIPCAAWPEVEWDENGYPTAEDDDFLAYAGLPLDFRAAADFIRRELPFAAEVCCASCEEEAGTDICGKPVTLLHFSTGGWSGAESLLAFIESRFDTRYFMLSWRRGGHYVFELPAIAMEAASAGETAGLDPQGDSAAIAQTPPPPTKKGDNT